MKRASIFVLMIFFAVPGIADEHMPADNIGVRQFSSHDSLDQMIRAAVSQTLSESIVEPRTFSGRYTATLQNLPKLRHAKFRAFVEDCAQTKVIPIKMLHSSDDKRAIFGVNFDGILGFHVFTK